MLKWLATKEDRMLLVLVAFVLIAVLFILVRTEMTRQMLNARAEIQVLMYRRAKENRPFNDEEVRRIESLWNQAEYDKANLSK